MALMEWNDKLSVGVDMIDGDHKRLVAMVNELHDAVRAARGKDVMGKVLDGLIEYTKTHFGREEAEMKKFNYPKAADHLREHAALAKQVIDVQAKYRAGNTAVLSMEVMAFLRDWLLKHIQASDRALGVFLIEQKKKKAA
jgi:hemerythrin